MSRKDIDSIGVTVWVFGVLGISVGIYWLMLSGAPAHELGWVWSILVTASFNLMLIGCLLIIGVGVFNGLSSLLSCLSRLLS